MKKTINHSMLLCQNSRHHLQLFSDTDWTGCWEPQISVALLVDIAFIFFFGCNKLNLWSLHKQKIVSRSSTEEEYRTLATTIAKLIWVQSLLSWALNFSSSITGALVWQHWGDVSNSIDVDNIRQLYIYDMPINMNMIHLEYYWGIQIKNKSL